MDETARHYRAVAAGRRSRAAGEHWERKVITGEQEKQLNRHENLGASCFVMVSFSFRRFFRVPWRVFRDMKNLYGRNYVTPEDLRNYEVEYRGGVLRFLLSRRIILEGVAFLKCRNYGISGQGRFSIYSPRQ